MDQLTENLPLLLITVVYIVDKMVGMLKGRGIDLHKLSRMIEDLWIWHNVADPDHQKSWYSRYEMLKEIIQKLDKGASNFDKTMIELKEEVKSYRADTDIIKAALERIEAGGCGRAPK